MNLEISKPFTDKDVAFLDSVLEKHATASSISTVPELDGFLTAIVSGPDTILPSQWMSEVWGGKDLDPVWDDEKEVGIYMESVFRLLNEKSRCLMDSPEDFAPLGLVYEKDGEEVHDFGQWCLGYMRGVYLCEDKWLSMADDGRVWLTAIFLIAEKAFNESVPDVSEKNFQTAISALEYAPAKLHQYWLKQREPTSLANPVDTSRR